MPVRRCPGDAIARLRLHRVSHIQRMGNNATAGSRYLCAPGLAGREGKETVHDERQLTRAMGRQACGDIFVITAVKAAAVFVAIGPYHLAGIC